MAYQTLLTYHALFLLKRGSSIFPKYKSGCLSWHVLSKVIRNLRQFFEGQFILVENVPAWVCEQCDDTLFDPDVVEKLQNHIWSHPQPVRALTVPVFDLAQAV